MLSIHPSITPLDPGMIELRRDFHSFPELSFEEHVTAKKVADALRSFPGVTSVTEGVGRTGVVALIQGGAGAGPCIALRADMDALPVTELPRDDFPYISKNVGVMHACGHDGHMASLLGAAQALGSMASSLRGCVKLIFQPAEEGYGGAREMIKDGVLEAVVGPRVDEIYGAHLWSYEPLGIVGARKGAMMAGSDKFTISILGKGGHGAAPQGTVDSIVVASTLVTALQTVVSRAIDPLEPAVLTVGTMKGGFGYNIIADNVEIGGTTRCFKPAVQETIKERMQCLCSGIGAAFGAECKLTYTHGYPPTVNTDQGCLDTLYAAAGKVVGAARVTGDVITCGAEDFSYFLQERPGTFFFVGAALPGVEIKPHHKSVFDFDERALAVTASVFVHLVLDKLGPQ